MTIAPTYLHPTPTRRRLLRDILRGLPARGTAAEHEMVMAGWIEKPVYEVWPIVDGRPAPWKVTAYGHAIQDVRILEAGAPDASPCIVAQVGDGDEPRVLGHVMHLWRPSRFEVTIGAISSTVRTRREAWGELWHRACIAYAAQAPISQP